MVLFPLPDLFLKRIKIHNQIKQEIFNKSCQAMISFASYVFVQTLFPFSKDAGLSFLKILFLSRETDRE